MSPERARELCQYLQTELQLASSSCESFENDPELVENLYKLLKPHYERLQDALYNAFQNSDSLRGPVERELGVDLGRIPDGYSYTDKLFNVIVWAESEGCLLELIAAAYKRRPGNPLLRRFVLRTLKPLLEEVISAAQIQPQVHPAQFSMNGENATHDAPLAPQGHEEAKVQPGVGFVKVGPEFELHQRCICRVEVPALRPQGTGFLMGKGIVITNYHVMRPVIEKSVSWEQVAFRFEYIESSDGKTLSRGVEYPLADNWLIAESEPLDYILLCLNNIPSDAPFFGRSDLEQRMYLAVKELTFLGGEELWIIQHPSGVPLRTTPLPGKVSRVDMHKQRVYYTTNTQGGSSGSPCIIEDGTVVALHSGGKEFEKEGIPFSAVLADLREKGLFPVVCK